MASTQKERVRIPYPAPGFNMKMRVRKKRHYAKFEYITWDAGFGKGYSLILSPTLVKLVSREKGELDVIRRLK